MGDDNKFFILHVGLALILAVALAYLILSGA